MPSARQVARHYHAEGIIPFRALLTKSFPMNRRAKPDHSRRRALPPVQSIHANKVKPAPLNLYRFIMTAGGKKQYGNQQW